MAKVFNLLNENKDIRDWQKIDEPYGPSTIEKIENPDGDYSISAPTSIPSPFARIDLVRSSFKYVTNTNDLDGKTIYHKLVSDCFDVAEMFFNIDKLGGKAKIESWDRNSDLKKLLNSNNPKHKLFGETLELFLKQDAQSNNFDLLKKVYFIFYDNKIIGGTSPTTLFFTSANDLSFINFGEGNDIYFDSDLCPLYKRDPEFQKYLYKLFKANSILLVKMREFYEYLEQNLKKLDRYDNKIYNEIASINKKEEKDLISDLNDNYLPIDTGIAGDNIDVIGALLKKRKIANRKTIIAKNSEFVIISNKSGKKPLVLQNKLSEELIYTDSNVKWNSDWEVPFYDSKNEGERTLPGQLDKYPYLTVSDFLQPYLVRIPFALNSKKYFDGNIKYESGDKNDGYLLPLTDHFFEYFDTTDLLKSPLSDGKPMIEMKAYANSVDVTLRIPIKGNNNVKYITFSRTYNNAGTSGVKSDQINNKGIIAENKVSLAIHPFMKMSNNGAHYRVMFLDKDRGEKLHFSYNLSFYKNANNKPLPSIGKKSRTLKETDLIQTEFYLIESDFDYFKINQKDTNGIILPLLRKEKGTKTLKFAVDFGTTNTHIEYKIDNTGPYPFEINVEDIQYETLHTPYSNPEQVNESLNDDLEDINEYIRHEFLPNVIGEKSEFKFPIRSATGESNTLQFHTTPDALADINIPFDYEKYASKRNTLISTNLKWSDFDKDNSNNKIRVESFIEKLILLIRAKVLHNDGNLKNTEVIWFYPSSMDIGKIEQLEKIWNKHFNKYINSKHTKKLSESIAPFYFYKNKRQILASEKPVVSIDIGGGTSDMVVFKQVFSESGKSNTQPILVSSSRYAANSIFGDAYGGEPEVNGFVLKYKDKINELLSKNQLTEIESAFNQIKNNGKSEDLVAFYFSIASNPKIKNKKIPLVFDEMLMEDNQLKIIFVVFFCSIIYHIAKLMKAKDLDYPEEILFSGTGAKVIIIANGGINLTKLNKVSTLIFEKVYKCSIKKDIQLIIEANPKEVTCKGGLEIDDDILEFKKIKDVLIGDELDSVISKSELNYNELNSNNVDLLKSIKNENENFIDLIFDINNDINFKNYFGINPGKFDFYKSLLKDDIMKFLNAGIAQKTNSLSGNTNIKIEETLFFYPLIGALNNLAYQIVVKDLKK